MCFKKGRRLPQAHSFAMNPLRDGLAQADAGTVECFDGEREVLDAAQAVVRATFQLRVVKLDYLDRIPYLVARLRQLGVKSRCMTQFASTDVSR